MSDLKSKIDKSIALLRKTEPLALEMSDKGFYLAFSGGKDSQCLYHVAKMAGVKFEAHYNLTTLDPPELVRFIKSHYPDVVIDLPRKSFWQLCIEKGLLPTRSIRFCCAELKETKGAGTCTLTGIRHAESVRRSKRNEVELSGRKFSGTLDQFEQHRQTEHVCIKGRDKIIVSPIIEWSDRDVWEFIRSNGIEYCKLYDEGFHRIGCIFCPMANKQHLLAMKERYPKYYDAFIRTVQRLQNNNLYKKMFPDLTAEEIFDWWISKESIQTWYAKNKQQMKLEI